MADNLASIEIIREKLGQASAAVREAGADLWLTFVQETSSGAERAFAYISPGHLTWESLVAVTASGERFLICGRFDQQVFEASGLYTEVITFVQDFREPFEALMKRLAPKKIAVNYSLNDSAADGITHGRFLYLQELLRASAPQAEIVSAEDVIGSLISQKSPREQANVQAAVDHTVAILAALSDYLRVGMTERQVFDWVNARIAERGLTPSFSTLVFAGDRGAGMGHGEATDNPIQAGDLVHVDMGVFVRGYASDMQRTWYILKEGEDRAPEAVQKGFDTIVKAIEASGAALKPGAKGIELDTISRSTVTGAGYPEYPHALGHQVGRNVHDGGALLGPAWARYKNSPFMPLEEGQVFTLEPSLNVEGFGAIGVEEDVVVTPQGARYLAPPQKELLYVR
jgi:Xaa-Pro aminopeptidase